jgi:hypothetical protein
MPPWFNALRAHALFPILLYLPLSQALRDNHYPVSHFPMYSNPTAKPLNIHSLTDATGTLLPVMNSCGVTPSHMSKMYGGYLKKMISDEPKNAHREGRAPRGEEELFPLAAQEVLRVLREHSLKRGQKWQLRQAIQLRESQVGFSPAGFTEAQHVLATLPAMGGGLP